MPQFNNRLFFPNSAISVAITSHPKLSVGPLEVTIHGCSYISKENLLQHASILHNGTNDQTASPSPKTFETSSSQLLGKLVPSSLTAKGDNVTFKIADITVTTYNQLGSYQCEVFDENRMKEPLLSEIIHVYRRCILVDTL